MQLAFSFLLLAVLLSVAYSANIVKRAAAEETEQPAPKPRTRTRSKLQEEADNYGTKEENPWTCPRPATSVFKCPDAEGARGGLYADPENCNCFYQCYGKTPYHKRCAEGLQFFDELSICDLPLDSECSEARK